MANFTWSYSALKEYENCPKKYYEIRVAQNYTVIPSEKMIYGTEVHKALEDYVRDGKELALNYLRFKGVVDELIAIPGHKYPEYEMALGKDKSPCAFDDPNRWVRGIVDLLIVDNDYAFIVDYKTGSNRYPDPKQLRLMSLMVFVHFPEVNSIKAGLLFVLKNSFIQESYTRDDIYKSWKSFDQSLIRLTNSYDTNEWIPNPTPLCGWCPVDTCEHHKPRR
jgi:CRISPR/Cas system-associated exonuclease Cas4 (RecB family)